MVPTLPSTTGGESIISPLEVSPGKVDSEKVELSDTVLAEGEILPTIGVVLALTAEKAPPGPRTLRPMRLFCIFPGRGPPRALAAAEGGEITSLGWSIVGLCLYIDVNVLGKRGGLCCVSF